MSKAYASQKEEAEPLPRLVHDSFSFAIEIRVDALTPAASYIYNKHVYITTAPIGVEHHEINNCEIMFDTYGIGKYLSNISINMESLRDS